MSDVLTIAASLALIYLTFSIAVSGLQEWWAQYRGHRGRFLRMGMQRLISDDAIFVRVLQHPLIGNLYRDRAARGTPPSYVAPGNFALAFADVVLRRAGGASNTTSDAIQVAAAPLTFDSLHDAVAKLRLQHSSAALAVLPIIESANGDLDVALRGLETWFSNGMDRVTGWYKARAQRRLFVCGLIVACLCDIDTIRIASTLDAAIASSAPGLPVGHRCLAVVAKSASDAPYASAADDVAGDDAIARTIRRCGAELGGRGGAFLALKVLGWALTALVGVFGATCWFGLATKVVDIRGAGPRPDDARSRGATTAGTK